MTTNSLRQCPCCDYFTLDRRGDFDICPVCGWEDDGLDPENPEQLDNSASAGGPNGKAPLEGRKIFRAEVVSKGLPPEAVQYKCRARNIPS